MGFFTEVEGCSPPPSSVSTTLVESWVSGKVRSKEKETAEAGTALKIFYWLWSSQAASVCQFFRAGGREGRPHPLLPRSGCI